MIYIIRHGQTALNKARALQGRSDLPLNEDGIAQAEAAGRALEERGIKISRVFSSPLTRAVRTAELVAPGAIIETDDRLLEMDYGPYEGVDLKDPPPEIRFFFSDFVNNPAPEGMEQLADVVKRAGSFIEEIKDIPGDILISTHAIAMKGILEYLTPGSNGSYWKKYIGNCDIFYSDFNEGGQGVPQKLE